MPATILTVTSTPSTFASGSFPLATLTDGPAYAFFWTPGVASTDAQFSGYEAFLATNDGGGLWLGVRRVELYSGAVGSSVLVAQSATLAWDAASIIRFVVNLAPGTNASSLVISGATAGNGTTTFTTSGVYFTASTLGVGQYTAAATFMLAGSMSSLDDDAPAAASGSASAGGVTASGATTPGTLASGAADAGGLTGAGITAAAALGSSDAGGVTGIGAAAPGTYASGAADGGGVSSIGIAVSASEATGDAALGGVESAGTAIAGSASVTASGAAQAGGVTSGGVALRELPTPPAVTGFAALVEAMDRVILERLG